jgi:hypothetical protein
VIIFPRGDRLGPINLLLVSTFSYLEHNHGYLTVDITEYSYLLVDQPTTDVLVKMLEDPDLQVSRGAAFLLIAAGSSARSGFAEVLKRFLNASSAEKRQEYEYILRNIGDGSHLHRLKGEAAKETNQAVRGGLDRIINAIEKLEDKGEAFMRYVK